MNKRTSLVTVGLPFYNAEDTLHLAIKSVLVQTYPDWELLLVDDGSTDDSLMVARKFEKLDPRIKVLTDGYNRGLIYRLNQLIDLTETRYIARMDADDFMLPRRLESQVNFMEQNPSVDLVDTAIFTIDEKDRPVGIRSMEPIDYDPKSVLKRAMIVHAAVVAKTSWFRKNRYDADFLRAEDYELWCRTAAFSRFDRIMEPLYVVREGRVNIENYKKSLKTVRKIIRQYGPGLLSPSELRNEVLKTRLKILAYSLTGFFHLQQHLSAMRNSPLDEKTAQHLAEMIQMIDDFHLRPSERDKS